eukprot:TRINITY_DN12078_c0_g4_i2.p2 TRINITY_DN12078_c0_g4~~TRINITY_DN12078_c0_g4_i2.p2  ORF type:complete len:105 (+),score=8.16 TRINITY_DN12078_c0_g4_i2:226-540(+)
MERDCRSKANMRTRKHNPDLSEDGKQELAMLTGLARRLRKASCKASKQARWFAVVDIPLRKRSPIWMKEDMSSLCFRTMAGPTPERCFLPCEHLQYMCLRLQGR